MEMYKAKKSHNYITLKKWIEKRIEEFNNSGDMIDVVSFSHEDLNNFISNNGLNNVKLSQLVKWQRTAGDYYYSKIRCNAIRIDVDWANDDANTINRIVLPNNLVQMKKTLVIPLNKKLLVDVFTALNSWAEVKDNEQSKKTKKTVLNDMVLKGNVERLFANNEVEIECKVNSSFILLSNKSGLVNLKIQRTAELNKYLKNKEDFESFLSDILPIFKAKKGSRMWPDRRHCIFSIKF